MSSPGKSHALHLEQEPTFEFRFPPLPRTATEVAAMVARPYKPEDTAKLAEVIAADPVVSALLFRRINSSYYALRREITDVREAVLFLGFRRTANLAFMASIMYLKKHARAGGEREVFDDVMRLSLGTALYAQELAGHLTRPASGKVAGRAYTAGLLYAVGRLVLLYNRPDDYEALWHTHEEEFAPSADREQVIFGTDHQELGRVAAEYWEFPAFVSGSIGGYLQPQEVESVDCRELASLLHMGVRSTEALYLERRLGEEWGAHLRVFEAVAVALPDSWEAAEVEALVRGMQERVYRHVEAMVGG